MLARCAWQILVLVSHHQTYTVWFYELKLAFAEAEAEKATADAKRKVPVTVATKVPPKRHTEKAPVHGTTIN